MRHARTTKLCYRKVGASIFSSHAHHVRESEATESSTNLCVSKDDDESVACHRWGAERRSVAARLIFHHGGLKLVFKPRLPAIMIEHMINIVGSKDGRHAPSRNVSVWLRKEVLGGATVSSLIEAQRRGAEEIEHLTMLVAQKDAEIAILKASHQRRT
ncbi:hypothetical protein HAX54_004147 [Datura stramonium]|uniref:Uncharacterized protein n=1 Tax=Datura stramonium TaxID=4076 RepID=A0ABS8WSP5_DATST|nr:hypothetical protein [Datura stramonium]